MGIEGISRQALSFRGFAIAILVLNAIGLYWIRREVRAGSAAGVWVERVSPTECAEETAQLAITFSRAVAPLDAVGETLAESPFQLEPHQRGHWRWQRPDLLTFVLGERLPPGRVFTLSATPHFEDLTGFALEGQTRFEVRTSALSVRSVQVEGVEEEVVVLGFRFDQPVAPADLLEHLEVRGIATRGAPPQLEPFSLEVSTTEARADSHLQVEVQRGEDPCLRVTLRAGLVGDGARLGLAEERSWDLELPDRFSLLSATGWASSRENRCTVTIRFSERLAIEQELPPIGFDPPVEGVRQHVSGRQIVAEGPFECGRDYRVRVGGTILSQGGKTLGQGGELTVAIPARDPDLFFPDDCGVLSPEGNLELALGVTNLTGVELSASRVHENNLVSHLHGECPSYTSRDLGTKKSALGLSPNEVHTTLIDLGTLLASPRGVYRIQAKATDEHWTRDWSLVRITDLSLNVKRERHGLLVWVTSLSKATPRAGIVVEALTANNQLLGGAVSDESGLAHLVLPDDHPDGDVFVVTARDDFDSTFLIPGQDRWVFDRVDTSGRPNGLELDCLLYAERGVYRPGDEVHLTGVLRDGEGGIPAGTVPLDLTVTRPDGQGSYRFAVLRAGEERVVGATDALVEAFVPARIEVAAELVERGPGEEADAFAVEVDARYLFGRPAGGLPVTVTSYWRRVDFSSRAFPEFTFDEGTRHPSRSGEETAAVLDADGHARVPVPPPGAEEHPGLWRATLGATVTEPGSRSVTRRVEATWDGAETIAAERVAGNEGFKRPLEAIEPPAAEPVRGGQGHHKPGEYRNGQFHVSP